MDSNLAFQEEPREELIGGETVLMAPAALNHVLIAGNIYGVFANYLRGKPCTPIADGAVAYLTETDRFSPDFMVVCDPDKLRPDGVHGAPDLAVEILSPSTAARDKTYKKAVYERCGVREYWIVSPGDRSVEQYLLCDGRLELRNVYTLCPDDLRDLLSEQQRAAIVTEFRCGVFDELSVPLDAVFARVGERGFGIRN